MSRLSNDLPEPDADARAHSERVSAVLREQIAANGGFLPFRDWMNTALYAPGLGYYVAGAQKFGADGDFVTAPELTPLFGRTLATDVAAILDASSGRHILELGAGSGKLARDILAGLDAMGAKVDSYSILELSADLAQRQRAMLGHDARVQWLSTLADTIDGAVVMNEVLDAIPPDIVSRRNGEWFERGVAVRDAKFVWAELPLEDASLQALAQARFPESGDYYSEINRGAESLVEDIGRRLQSGALLLIDYGFSGSEYFHSQRAEGTVMAHYRHRSSADPFIWPGLADLTTHVDFSAIAAAGERAGLTVDGFTSQASFLVSSGILDLLSEVAAPESLDYLQQTGAVQKLLAPEEMGELFKVLMLARSRLEGAGFRMRNAAWKLAQSA